MEETELSPAPYQQPYHQHQSVMKHPYHQQPYIQQQLPVQSNPSYVNPDLNTTTIHISQMSHADPMTPMTHHHHMTNGHLPVHPNMSHMNGQMAHHPAQNYSVHFPANKYKRPEYV